jgi:uncharacterized Fe-S cluster-containing radical SAM superfamily protein
LLKDGILIVGRLKVVRVRVAESVDRARVDESVVEEIVVVEAGGIVIGAETVIAAEIVQRHRSLSRVDATTGRTRYGKGLRRVAEVARRRVMMR